MPISPATSEKTRFGKFALVGIAGSVVDFGVFNLLATILGVNSILASAISFSLAVINNFILNRIWTFPESRSTPALKQLVQFSIVSVIGLAIRIPMFAWLEKQLIPLAANLHQQVPSPTFIGHNVSLAIVILIVMLWNFIANRYWTFKMVPVKVNEELKR